MGYIPSQVYEVAVVACIDVNVNPTVGWSDGIVFNSSVCCFPICRKITYIENLHYPGNTMTCQSAAIAQQNSLQSPRYVKHCQLEFGPNSTPVSITVMKCLDANQTPTASWPGGIVL